MFVKPFRDTHKSFWAYGLCKVHNVNQSLVNGGELLKVQHMASLICNANGCMLELTAHVCAVLRVKEKKRLANIGFQVITVSWAVTREIWTSDIEGLLYHCWLNGAWSCQANVRANPSRHSAGYLTLLSLDPLTFPPSVTQRPKTPRAVKVSAYDADLSCCRTELSIWTNRVCCIWLNSLDVVSL